MNIIQYKGFKNIFVGLCQKDGVYYILYGITGEIKIENKNIQENYTYRDISIFNFLKEKTCNIIIPFLSKNNNLFTIKTIRDIDEYHNLISVLEDLL